MMWHHQSLTTALEPKRSRHVVTAMKMMVLAGATWLARCQHVKGKGREPLDTRERWPRERSSSQTLSNGGDEMTVIARANAVAERLSDLQVELSHQDEELDALYKAMKNHQTSVCQHLVDEA